MASTVMTGFEERPFRASDLDALERIEKQAGAARWDRRTLEYMAERFELDTRVILPDASSRIPIGFYVVEHGDEILYLCNLAVDPEWRRQGAAGFALQEVEVMGRDLNYRQIALDVQEENLPAQLLYRKHGYRVSHIVPGLYDRQDGFHMIKSLD